MLPRGTRSQSLVGVCLPLFEASRGEEDLLWSDVALDDDCEMTLVEVTLGNTLDICRAALEVDAAVPANGKLSTPHGCGDDADADVEDISSGVRT